MQEHLELMWWRGSGIVVTGVQSRNQGIIQVYCPEMCPVHQGEIQSQPEEETVDIKGTDALPQTPTKVKITTNIYCEYMGDTHSTSVPDIVPGEQVMVHRHRGDDRYFWIPFRDDHHLRTEEHYRIAMMNKEHQNEESQDETYFFEIDTKFHKGVRIKTSNKKGEEFVYLFEIDTENNKCILTDDFGNFIQLQSAKPNEKKQSITLFNNRGTFIQMYGDDIYATAPKNISATAGENIFATAKKMIQATAGQSATVTAPQITLDGNVKITGTLMTGGHASFPSHSGAPKHYIGI